MPAVWIAKNRDTRHHASQAHGSTVKLELTDDERRTLLRLVRDAGASERPLAKAMLASAPFPVPWCLPDGRAFPVERSDADSKVSPPQGRQCRKLLAIATVPEVRAQPELWAHDFDDEAVKAELTRRPS
jgi:hypothetical protein